MRRLAPVLLLLAACSPAASGASGTTPLAPGALDANATMVSVVDGDTIVASINGRDERIRLIGIDTPETKKPDTPVQCFGLEASSFTTRLLPKGVALHLERDVEARDRYGRLLAYVYLAADGTFVNLQIVRQGYARLLTFPPNVAHVGEFVAAARAAERDDIGLWDGCSG